MSGLVRASFGWSSLKGKLYRQRAIVPASHVLKLARLGKLVEMGRT